MPTWQHFSDLEFMPYWVCACIRILDFSTYHNSLSITQIFLPCGLLCSASCSSAVRFEVCRSNAHSLDEWWLSRNRIYDLQRLMLGIFRSVEHIAYTPSNCYVRLHNCSQNPYSLMNTSDPWTMARRPHWAIALAPKLIAGFQRAIPPSCSHELRSGIPSCPHVRRSARSHP